MANALTPLNYLGGKTSLSPQIVAQLGRHKLYAELFFGSGAVLYRKEPAPVEIVNDRCDRVVNFFRVLREQTPELKRLLTATPYSRREYELADEQTGEPLEDARRFFVRSRQSFSGNANDSWSRTLSKSKATDFANVVDDLERFAERMRRVQIENRHWRELLPSLDTAGTVIYLDPPYVHSTRSGSGDKYRFEMTEADHVELLEALLKMKRGKWILSGFESDLYRSYLNRPGVNRLKFEQVQKVSWVVGTAMPTRYEMLWMN